MSLTFTTLLTCDTGPVLYWLTGAHDDHTAFAAQVKALAPCTLIACQSSDWNNDYSPWPATALPGQAPFEGRGADTLAQLLAHIQSQSSDRPVLMGGYSLAGLFALWAHAQCSAFSGVAACSPSLWYPFWNAQQIAASVPSAAMVYLSLGRREEKTRHPVLSTVGDALRTQHEALKARSIPTTLVWHDGGHFTQPTQRMTEGFMYLLSHL